MDLHLQEWRRLLEEWVSEDWTCKAGDVHKTPKKRGKVELENSMLDINTGESSEVR